MPPKSDHRLFLRGRTYWANLRDARGRRIRVSTHQTDYRAALAVHAVLAVQYADPTYATKVATERARAVTLDTALERLLDDLTTLGRSEATLEIRRCKAGHLVRVLGPTTPLGELSPSRWEDYRLARSAEGASAHTIAKELGTLRAAFRNLGPAAPHDPGPCWPRALRNYYRARDQWWSEADYHAVLAEVPPPWRDHLTAFVYTGCRLSELYRLEARHYDRARAMLHIAGTKTAGADRWIPVHPVLAEVLDRKVAAKPRGQLFPTWAKLHATLHRACVRAEVTPTSPNDLRRTFCSWLCNAGVPEAVAAKLLGHASSTMVRRVYAQYADQTLAGAVARLPGTVGTEGVSDVVPVSDDSYDPLRVLVDVKSLPPANDSGDLPEIVEEPCGVLDGVRGRRPEPLDDGTN